MPGSAPAFVKLGYDFVAIAGDVWLLQQAFASAWRRYTRASASPNSSRTTTSP
jgi:hypothetical protein